MKTPDASHGGAAGSSKNHRSPRHEYGGQATNHLTAFTKRSKIMKYTNITQLLSRGVSTLLILTLMATMAMAQSLVVTGGGSFSGTGTINVKGNINTSGASGGVSITGTVNLNGTTATQLLGVSGSNALTFATLQATGDKAKQMDVDVTATAALTVNITGALLLDLQAKTLTLGGTSTLTSGSLDVTDASSTVVYNQTGGSQTALGLTYAGALTLSGTSAKNFSASGSVAGAFSHTGGALTVDQDFTVSYATPSFATIADVTAGKTLALSGTGAKTIAAITATNATGAINNSGGSGLLTVTALNGNAGTISGGAGGATFTNAATNTGAITGGSGLVTFSSTLAHSAGTVTSGSGGIAFTGTPTFASGTITSGTGLLNFNANVANSGTAALSLTGAATAEFSGTVNTTGLAFASGSTVTYDGVSAGQVIADVDYGNLTLKNSTKAWTLGAARAVAGLDVQASSATTVNGSFDLNVSGNVALASDLTKSANAVVFANASSAVSGTNEISGSVTRTHAFAAAAYTFNNASMTLTPSVFGALTSFTMKSEPSTNPGGYNAGNTVNRKYTPSYAGTFTADLKLSYLSGELGGAVEAKLRQFQGGTITSLTKRVGTYARVPAGTFGTISLAGLTNATLASASEMALDDRFGTFTSIAATNWNVGSTWDEGSVPTATDEVVINTSPVTVPDGYAASALSATINATMGLVVGGGTSGSLAVGTGGLTNNSAATGLTVAAGASVTITGADLTNTGAISNAGTITVQ